MVSPAIVAAFFPFFFIWAGGVTFEIRNNCPYIVWAAAIPGGGRRLDIGETWSISVAAATKSARIWPRTGCIFDGSGRGRCQTGDCGGVLGCTKFGSPPNTLVEYSINQFNNLDFFDVSLVDGFNVPVQLAPFRRPGGDCKSVQCAADIKQGCPEELKAPGGCNNPCTVFKTDEYCCTKGRCGPTAYSRFFKRHCPDAYSYPMDDETATFTCPGVTHYRVVFCPDPTSGLLTFNSSTSPFQIYRILYNQKRQSKGPPDSIAN